jgi:hypothetical protein
MDSTKLIGCFFTDGGGVLNCSNGLLLLSYGPGDGLGAGGPALGFLNCSNGLEFLSYGPLSLIWSRAGPFFGFYEAKNSVLIFSNGSLFLLNGPSISLLSCTNSPSKVWIVG